MTVSHDSTGERGQGKTLEFLELPWVLPLILHSYSVELLQNTVPRESLEEGVCLACHRPEFNPSIPEDLLSLAVVIPEQRAKSNL